MDDDCQFLASFWSLRACVYVYAHYYSLDRPRENELRENMSERLF
jgi:hypothetical protein